MTLSQEDRFNTEVIKLLLKVAWSDRQLNPREHQVIFGMGRSWNVPEHALQELMGKLQEGSALPEPDMAVLRTRPDDVLTAVRALAAADGKLGEEETRIIEQLAGRLQGEPLVG